MALRSRSNTPDSFHVRYWGMIVAIVILGAVLRFTGYNFGLPYIDSRDESNYLVETFTVRGLYNMPSHLRGYPPGIFWVDDAAESIIEQFGHHSALEHPADTINLVRILDILVSLATIPIVGLIARRLKGDLAGVAAAAAWAVVPLIVSQSSLAMPDAWLLLCSAIALYCAIVGLEADWPGWLIISVLAGLGAILFKYSQYPILGPAVAVTLWRLRAKRTPWLQVLIVQATCTLLCAQWLFVVYGAANVATIVPESATFQKSALTRVIDFQLGGSLVSLAISQIGLQPLLYLVAAVLYLLLARKQLPLSKWLGCILILLFALISAWLTATYIDIAVNLGGYYVLAADIGFVALAGVAAASVSQWIAKRFNRSWLKAGVVILLVAVWLGPLANTTWAVAQQNTFPDTRAAIQSWSANALPPGTVVIDKYNNLTFNREWGGYDGPYRVFLEQNLTEHPIPYWLENHVYYAALTQTALLQANDVGRGYLNQMLLLKQFPPAGQRYQWRGPTTIIYRLWGIQHPLQAEFGQQIRLIGYDFTRVGSVLHITLYWQAPQRPTDNYNVFVHLTKMDSLTPVAQVDGPPLAYDHPTLDWDDPAETLVSRDFQIQLPGHIHPGQYRIITGLYNYQTGQRLTTNDQNYVELTTVVIGGEDNTAIIKLQVGNGALDGG